jgi:CRISPR/Cas system-associated protein endoribonuclease Cas2
MAGRKGPIKKMKSQFKCGWAWMITSLPSFSPADKAASEKFRRYLRGAGWFKLGSQIWARPCHRGGLSELVEDVAPHVPPAGNVRLVWITDYQWGDSRVVVGKNR